ncbi:hypothetical protein [Streptomyces subrutilus]|uniref:Uncharacterized protein n=1 Tax=Streptomyces subrutilus TaxID=36818 RepID=A0A918QEX4_9ACTN|nr:hypothetical protein [Streptomyces subrutilus]WSJ33867.1 hypothetical protein OG479_33645 [Streptomyces subrutilus]GGZ45098.1 hypothetical protein GCM10010371_00040 [Streptomyces subrutilus]
MRRLLVLLALSAAAVFTITASPSAAPCDQFPRNSYAYADRMARQNWS